MSIESDLSSIAKSLALIADHLTATVKLEKPASINPVTYPPVVEAAPAPKPVVVEAPVIAQPAPIPTVPVTVTPAPAVAAPVAPATASLSKEQFTSEIMATYKALGPVKGAGIQQVLAAHGAVNINDIKPEQYAAVLAQVKAL